MPEKPPDAAFVNQRIEVCRQCSERPEGCWKNQAYGCFREYHAGRRAAETKDCPINKLN